MCKSSHNAVPIEILGATQNNLKGIDVTIPSNSLTVVTGLSGSGKSSLAFDTLYAEGQRRYVESMSAYARQFLERIPKPAVREIRGISPAIAIRQKTTTRNPRSTVGTVTEILDFLRLLFSRAGTILCRECHKEVKRDTVDAVVDQLLLLPEGTRVYVSFPFSKSALDLIEDSAGGEEDLEPIIENLLRQGFHRLVKAPLWENAVRQLPAERPRTLHDLAESHILVDRLQLSNDARERLSESLELSFVEGNGIAQVTVLKGRNGGPPPATFTFSQRFECQDCDITYAPLEPRLFSFNNPYGACPTCHGFGNTITLAPELVIPDPQKTLLEAPIDPFTKPRYVRFQRKLVAWAEEKGIPLDVPFEDLPEEVQRMIWQGDKRYKGIQGFFDFLSQKKYKMHIRIFISRYRGYSKCTDCNGERLRTEARDVYIGGRRIGEVAKMTISEAEDFFAGLEWKPEHWKVANKLVDEIRQRLSFLLQVGLDYLTLDRMTSTLSGGETQRINLAASLGSSLAGTLYVLDEPSIGLHPRDQTRLVNILLKLRDLGNTIVVVEHEQEIIASADSIIDMGPGAGERGGQVVFAGSLRALLQSKTSLTGRYLSGHLKISVPVFRRPLTGPRLLIEEASQHNLKNISVEIPMGVLVCVTGVSGSGKSTLVHDVLFAGIKKLRGEWNAPVGKCKSIEGWPVLTDILMVDQSPIGRTPRSNPVTYIKAFDDIRKTFSSLREAQSRNLMPAHFSFNVSGGRCEACQGSGILTVEMQFLADVELQCEECGGKRFQKQVLEVRYKGKNIDDVLNMTVEEASEFFNGHPSLLRKFKVLQDVGLGYLRLGQSATTLSGGEAQRVKLASYLAKTTAGRPLFIFDEPTTGLHFDDIQKLLRAFDRLISKGATILVIEHNLDVIKSADWLIDLGPEGGAKGGELLVQGTPEDVARCEHSYTGAYLRNQLQRDNSKAK